MAQTAYVDIDILLGKKVQKMFYRSEEDKIVIEFDCGFELVLDSSTVENLSPKPTSRTFDNYRWSVGCLVEG